MRHFTFSGLALFLCFSAPAQITLTGAVAMLRQTDFADANTWLYPEFNRDSNWIEVTKNVGDCQKKVAFINPETKAIQISPTLKSWPYCRRLADMVAASPLVIEGECLEQGPAYQNSGGTLPGVYTPHLIKILRIFKGQPYADTIVVIRYGGRLRDDDIDIGISDGQINLPGKGDQAVLFAAPFPESQFHNAGPHLNRYPKWAASEEPLYLQAPNYYTWYSLHIEDNLYKELEAIVGQPRRIIAHPSWSKTELPTHRRTKKWSQEPALSYLFGYAEITGGELDTLSVHLQLQSALDNTYPLSGELRFHYSPVAFGKRVVGNKYLRATTQVSNFGIGRDIIYKALFPRYYQVSITDLDDSTVLIRFQCKDLKRQPVMLPYQEAQPFVDLFFPIKNYEVQTGFMLSAPSSTRNKQRRFDYEKARVVPYRLIQTTALPPLPVAYFLKPEILSFYPDTVVAGSDQIVTIEGRRLRSESTWIGIPCAQGYCFIKDLLECTDTRIRFTVPVSAVGSVNRLEKLPSGAIKFMVLKRAGSTSSSCVPEKPLFIKKSQ